MKIPLNETRIFTFGILDNMIKYTIINDKNIDKCTIAVCIKTGSINDPKDIQGIAHFLEHMLFLGSKKYPKENHFEEKLKCNGGNSNAYTSTYETVYYFSVIDDNLEEILDIFANFFIEPLFDKGSVEREINAINSEHMKNINNDGWRIYNIIKGLSKKNSIINKFSTGNLETLNKKDVREKMIDFYKKYYYSENICVSIVSSKSNKETEALFSKTFGQVPLKKGNGNPDTFSKDKINAKQSGLHCFYDTNGTEYHLIPVMDKNIITYFWEIPLPFKFLKNKIYEIIEENIENEDKTNLKYFLQNKKLINYLNCYQREEGIFILDLDINSNYSKDIKDTIREINGYVKYYFNNLVKLDWHKIYDYYKKKYNLLFDYSGKKDEFALVESIAINMHYFPSQNYYNGNLVVLNKEYAKLIEQLDNLKFDKATVIYSSKEKFNVIKYETDKYYNAKYGKLKNSLLDVPEKQFHFDVITENIYYNVKPTVYPNLDQFIKPSLIKPRVWYGAVSKFKEPKINGYILMNHKNFFDTIENYVCNVLACHVINVNLANKFNKEADLGYYIQFMENIVLSNITILITGLNDKYDYFFSKILEHFRNILLDSDNSDCSINDCIIQESTITSKIDKLKEYYINNDKLIPWKFSTIKLTEAMIKYFHPREKLLDFLVKTDKQILIKKVRERINSLVSFKDIPISIMFYGNLKKEMIPDISLFKENLELSNYGIPPITEPTSMDIKHPNKDEENNMVIFIYPTGLFNPKENIKLIILSILIEQPCYDYLRTKNQLGYLVSSNIQKIILNYYLTIKVQTLKDVSIAEEKMNLFIEYFKKLLETKLLESSELAKIKDVTRKLISEKESNTNELLAKYLPEIISRQYLFNRRELLLEQLDNISRKDIINYFNKITNNKIVIKII
jgi:insulysin